MRLLLDTNVALWAITADDRLGSRAAELIGDRSNGVWVSAATLWEIAIKHALRRGEMPVSAADARGYFRDAGYATIGIEPAHVLRVEHLPQVHADPFDRILVAQALEEGMHLLTRDRVLPEYSDLVIPV